MLVLNSFCCGRSLRTGGIIVAIFYLVVSICSLIYCIVNVASVLNGEEEVSRLETSNVFKMLPPIVQEKLSALSIKRKNEFLKSVYNPLIEFEDASSVSRRDTNGVAIFKLIISLLHVLSNTCLLIGILRDGANLVFTWMWTQVVLFFLSCGLAIIVVLSFISNLNVLGECLLVACIIAYLGVSLYCFSLVNSYYHYMYEPCLEEKEDYDKSTLQLV